MAHKRIVVGSAGKCGSILLEYGLRAIRRFKKISAHEIYIMRTHTFRPKYINTNPNTIACTTIRDLREIIASMKRYVGNGNAYHPPRTSIYQECKKKIDLYYQWKEHSNFEFMYEEFIINKEKYIKQMFDVFNIEPTAEDIAYMMKHTEQSYKTPTHITNKEKKLITYKDTLTEAEIQEIYDFVEKENIDKDKFLYVDKL